MPLVLVSFSNGIDTITLNNPKKRNALRETLINCHPVNNQHGKRKRGFRFPSFSTSYRRWKWRHIPVPQETRINQRFLSTDNLAARIAENSPLVVSVLKEQLRVISEAVPLNPEGF